MVTVAQVRQWIAGGESETLELKRSTGSRRDALHVLCGMLNTRGGRLVFGVEPSGTIIGQQVTDRTIEQLAGEIREIDPPVFPTIDRLPIGGGKELIVLSVTRGHTRPYMVHGTAYRRVGNTTTKMSRAEVDRTIVERLHSDQRWETAEAVGWTIDDLDTAEITRTLEEAIRRQRVGDPGTRNSADILRGMGLLRNGRLMNAAPVLFGRSEAIQTRLTQCVLRVARFRGTDKHEFIDNRQLHGNAFQLLAHAERFMREHLPVAGRIEHGIFERTDDPLYPPASLREALANAICHRDYSIGGGSIAIAIFDDRLEISSSGTLHFGLTSEDLFRDHESLPWNPLIAAVLYMRGIVERWGRGTQMMAELAQRAGQPRPDIEEHPGAVTVRFRPSRYIPPERVHTDLTEHQRRMLADLEISGRMALRDFRQRFPDRPEWMIKDDLATLKHLRLVDSRGHGRGAYWTRC